MGAKQSCIARYRGKSASGEAQLETDYVLFRSDAFRVKLHRREIRDVTADKRQLSIKGPDGNLVLLLGPASAKWAEKILNPPSLLQKLGIKPNHRVAIFGLDDAKLRKQIELAAGAVTYDEIVANTDVVLRRIDTLDEIRFVKKDRRYLSPRGAIWLIFPKGRQDIKAATILPLARAHHLVDNRVIRFSDTLTALRFAQPKSANGADH